MRSEWPGRKAVFSAIRSGLEIWEESPGEPPILADSPVLNSGGPTPLKSREHSFPLTPYFPSTFPNPVELYVPLLGNTQRRAAKD